jgi:hypothetical protein
MSLVFCESPPHGAVQFMRAGKYVTQLDGCRAFVPAPLPPAPPLAMDGELT